ncbi:MAG: glycosyltransferase [Pedobacter sp.]|nr:MAG: glycosyltransferase [Pedobacter sp.]
MLANKNTRLAIISTHPIQYYAPVFKLLAQKTSLMVFYTKNKTFDRGFQQKILWDIPLLEEYKYAFAGKSTLKEIASFQPDHIIIYGWAHFLHLRIMRHFKGKIPILFRGDSNLLVKHSTLKNFCKRLALQFIYKHIDKALYVGINNKDYFKQYGIKEAQLFFAPHAIDNHRFATTTKSELRNELKIKPEEILILYAGKFEPVKNPGLLLQAFLELRLPHAHLLFTGDGILKKALKTQSRPCKKVHFMSFQNQSKMPGIYQSCDLFCLPSNGDSWGLAVNEAMAAGKAILVSDKVGAAADLVTKENGKIFKHNDLKDLKRNLLELITNRSDLQQKGKSSFKIIADWNFENQVDHILNAISN